MAHIIQKSKVVQWANNNSMPKAAMLTANIWDRTVIDNNEYVDVEEIENIFGIDYREVLSSVPSILILDYKK